MDLGVTRMPINVLFFASARDVFGQSEAEIELTAPISLLAFKQQLAEQLQVDLAKVALLRAAIDQDFARDDDLIDPAKHCEVALFPPVTGG